MRARSIAPIIAFAIMVKPYTSIASELRYEPINPSFGGDSFNSAHLLAIAEAQNDNVRPRVETDPIEEFEDRVVSTLLGQLSRDISDSILGENGNDAGTLEFGDTTINYIRNGDSVLIDISNDVRGSQTTVEVPLVF